MTRHYRRAGTLHLGFMSKHPVKNYSNGSAQVAQEAQHGAMTPEKRVAELEALLVRQHQPELLTPFCYTVQAAGDSDVTQRPHSALPQQPLAVHAQTISA